MFYILKHQLHFNEWVSLVSSPNKQDRQVKNKDDGGYELIEFIEYCQEQIVLLDKVIERCENCLKNAPEGSLRVTKNKNNYQFYHRVDGRNTTGKYLKKSERELAAQLAQKDYALKMLRLAMTKKKEMEKCAIEYDWKEFENVHKKILLPKQELIVPFVLSEEEYVIKWEQQNKEILEQMKKQGSKKYKNINKFELTNENGILTEKGELVRSKSEKILADKLYMMGIPYVYELPLYLKGYGNVRPDFTVLNKRMRKTLYLEHFGMMEDTEYCEKAIKKIELYEKNGIYVGKNLIVTYETWGYSMNMKVLENKLREYLY